MNRTRAELNAVRAHSRLSESLSNQYGKIIDRRSDTNAMNANNNSDNLPPPESPIFSEDMGPPSPLKFEMKPSPERQNFAKQSIKNAAAEISVMRAKFDGKVGLMRN